VLELVEQKSNRNPANEKRALAMSNPLDPALRPLDHDSFLRRAFAMARQAHANGNHPFGAILVDADGRVLIEAANGYLPARDMTAHAERLLATQASRAHDPSFLALHRLCIGRAVRDVRRRNLLGWHRPGRIWARRVPAESGDR